MKNEYLALFREHRVDRDILSYFAGFDSFSGGPGVRFAGDPIHTKIADDFIENVRRRQEWTRQYAWAVPSGIAIEAIAHYSPIVEMGAGTGYWSALLRATGADVIAYDTRPAPLPNHWCGPITFTEVLRGSPGVLKKHSDRTLFLCWPPMSTMAYNAVRQWRGETLVYVGEDGGCNADAKFFSYIARHFRQLHRIRIPQYTSIHDALYIYRRRPKLSKP